MKHFRLETREDPAVTGDLATAITAVNELRAAHGTFEQRMAEQMAALTARLDEREVRSQRPGVDTTIQNPDEARAFTDYLRTGVLDTRTMNSAQASAGGVLVPPSVATTIIQRVIQFSPIRSLATVLQMNTGLVQLPNLDVEAEVPETGSPEVRASTAETEPELDLINLVPYEIPVKVPVSRTLLEDSAVDLIGFLSNHVAQKYGQRESALFLKGTGVQNTPIGILADTRVTALDAASTSIAGDDVIDLYHSVSSAYAMNGVFLANRKTMAALRKLKDTTGQYLFQPALSAGTPPTLHGRPLLEAPELDDPTTGKTPLLFGDFRSGFTIGDRVAFEVEVDRITGADQGKVYLRFRRRVGGVVTLGEAIAKLKLR